jgi:Uma2 family endonuclease
MSLAKPYVEQTDPPRSPRETLPTMYDLPSEDPNEPGLPDEYHYLQPQLLSATFRLSDYAADQIFTAGDLNIYYNVRRPLWHKRPDWFAVVGVPRLYDQQDLRLSYVIWQEGVSPSVVVELLSPGTEDEDLGRTERETESRPPTKWHVYEQILRVPYYVVFNRYTDELRAFTLVAGQYQALDLSEPRIWIPSLNIGLGLWQGEQRGITRQWLRWYDVGGHWIPTEAEQAEQAQQRAEQAQQRAEKLAERLRSLGIDPEAIDEEV